MHHNNLLVATTRQRPILKIFSTHSLRLCALVLTILAGALSAPAQTDTAIAKEDLSATLDSLVDQDKTIQPQLYRMNYWLSAGISLASTAANIYAVPNIIKAKQPMSDAELAGLDKTIFSGFDRWALTQDPAKRDINYQYSDYLLPVIIAGAGTLAFDKKIRRDWLRLLMLYYETHAITFNLYNFSFFGPAFQNKVRPIAYYDEYFTADQRRAGNNRNSLYSGHTASAAASTFFLVKVYSDYHPEIGGRKYLYYALASIPPLAEGYLRMQALAHFPSDVLVGFVIGATCGVLVPELHRLKRQGVKLGVAATPVGPGISLTWRPGTADD